MITKSITKKIAVAAGLLALTFAPGITRAQDTQPPAQDQTQAAPAAPAQQQARRHGAMAGLNLTEDQKTQMKSIRESMKTRVEAVKNDESLTPDQKGEKIHQLRRSARVEMVKLLTPEQRQQMKANIREMRAARREQQQQPPQAQPQG
jgi:Spy/CpxP family protein refolding chaperone